MTASSNLRLGVTREELIDFIQKHEVHLDGRGGGVRANLGPAEIANPDGTSNSARARLTGATLTGTELQGKITIRGRQG